jgi:molecular chaperone DnaK (HSP70)
MVHSFMYRRCRILIAIEIGTDQSGYAYQFIEEKDVTEPTYRNKWADTNEFYPKTLTEILFAPDGSVAAWGHSAKKKFAEMKEEGKERGYIFIDNFKTILYDGQNRDENGPYIIKEGKKFSILYLIAEFIKLLRVEVLKDIALELGGDGLLDESDIRWCLTVPAIWKEDSKQIMRHAARLAGLIGEGNEEAERLLLVSEPEAAAVHCVKFMSRQNNLVLAKGSTIMLVDAREETIAISVHEAKDNFDEIIPPIGGLYGSKSIDRDFRGFLDRKLSSEAMEEFDKEWPVGYTTFMDSWENLKCGYHGDPTWKNSIDIPRRLEQILEHRGIWEDLAEAQGGDDTAIKLNNEDMEGIFKPTINQIIYMIRCQFNLLKNSCCDCLFLVGDFAEYPLLQNHIQQEFSSYANKIVVPDRPGAAVLLGAAYFGSFVKNYRTNEISNSYRNVNYFNTLEKDKMNNYFRDKQYKIAIAIDFGTARSGYAYQFIIEKDVTDPTYRNKWVDTNEFYPKTLTEILFAPDGSVAAWGHSAKKKFAEMKEEGKERGYIFIDNFKTILHDGQDRDENGPYIIKEGKKFSILYLIAEFIKLLKVEVLKDINLGLGGDGLLDEGDIRWCLTIPAIWKEDSKQMMRRAAEIGGLIGEGPEEAERLLLVFEPEAAAIHCQQVMLRRSQSDLVEKGKTIMIVDAGGGTVDITVHEVIKNEGLEELIPSGGGLHGSKYVDRSFREFLDRKLSSEAMEEFEKEWPVEYTKFIETWESVKCGHNPNPTWKNSIDLPRRLEQILERRGILEDLAEAQGGNDTVIKLNNEDMEGIFTHTVNKLISQVSNQFTALSRECNPSCDILFLVGGFAQSPLLQDRIKEEFETKMVQKVIIPDRPGAAVLLGAASYCVNPQTIIKRCSKLTIGIRYAVRFEDDIDPEENRISKELATKIYQQQTDYDLCDNRFDIFVAAGERVPTDAVVVRRYIVSPDVINRLQKFLSTPNPKVRYADEEGVDEIASVTIRLPFKPQDNEAKIFDIEMKFGLSEVEAYAIDPISGNREKCNFKFVIGS